SHFVGVCFVGPGAIDTNSQNLGIQLFKIAHVIDEASVLVGAGGAPIKRIPDQNDVLFSGKIGKLYFFLVLILQAKVRRGLPYSDGHDASDEIRRTILADHRDSLQTEASGNIRTRMILLREVVDQYLENAKTFG